MCFLWVFFMRDILGTSGQGPEKSRKIFRGSDGSLLFSFFGRRNCPLSLEVPWHPSCKQCLRRSCLFFELLFQHRRASQAVASPGGRGGIRGGANPSPNSTLRTGMIGKSAAFYPVWRPVWCSFDQSWEKTGRNNAGCCVFFDH